MVGFDKTLVVCNKSLLDHLETFYSTLHSCRDTCFGNMMTSSSGTMFRVTGPLCVCVCVCVGGGGGGGGGGTLSFDVFFNLCLNKRLSNAGDFRRHRAHYDATVMVWAVLARVQYIIHMNKLDATPGNAMDPCLAAVSAVMALTIWFMQCFQIKFKAYV